MHNLTAVTKYKDCIMHIATMIMKEYCPSEAASGKSFIFHYWQIIHWKAEKILSMPLTAVDEWECKTNYHFAVLFIIPNSYYVLV